MIILNACSGLTHNVRPTTNRVNFNGALMYGCSLTLVRDVKV